MKKYIDAEQLSEKIESIGLYAQKSADYNDGRNDMKMMVLDLIDSLQQEQSKIDLEKFTEKMDAWKAKYNRPDNITIKATMAFTARMFYMYPDVAREWYDNLPKSTMD